MCVCLSFSRSSNSFSPETMKLKYRKKNPIRLCTMHYDTGLYSVGCKEAVKHCVRDELTRINPISAGVLENQDMLIGGQFDTPPPLKPMFDVQI